MSILSEQNLTEQPVIIWLKELGYEYAFGPEISPGGKGPERKDYKEVILGGRLRKVLERLNPHLNQQALFQAEEEITKIFHPNLETANHMFYQLLKNGVPVEIRKENGEIRGDFAKIIDFKNPQNNDFLVVNQFAIQGPDEVKRPDVIIFVNGLPLAVFELKNPTIEEATVYTAFKQIQDYKKEIPQLFVYNQVIAISDLLEAKHGTISSSWEFFKAWRAAESEEEKNEGTTQLELLAKGIFHKTRFLDILENFIVFEKAGEKFIKKIAQYHQYFGVNRAVESTKKAVRGDKRIGVFWHTQGSGKSLSMVFFVNKLRTLPEFATSIFVFLTDELDLDNQLYKTFLSHGYPFAKRAQSIEDLKEKIKKSQSELIFTTIQKFQEENGQRFSILSERKDIIVISDEAHRSQYGKLALNVRDALPNASFIGFTATPISLKDRVTTLVFGDYVSKYQIDKSVADGTTVPIYYESRLVPLHLSNEFIDEEIDQILEEKRVKVDPILKRKWARLEQLVGSEDRLKKIAEDIAWHFKNRGYEGKGMVVAMSRRIAVRMYELLKEQKGMPEIAVVISGLEDFKDRVQKELNRKELERRFKDDKDPLKIAVVCDMWLTGFDVPCLTTMYFDKPMKNHGLMQAIARVNRVYKDKKGGLVVDYIGIADDLKKSLAAYSSEYQQEALVSIEELVKKMREKYDIVLSYLTGVNIKNWQALSNEEKGKLLQKAVNAAVSNPKTGQADESRQKEFIKESGSLISLFALVMPHSEAGRIRDEVEFIKMIRSSLVKITYVVRTELPEEIESVVKQTISESIKAEGVINLFSPEGQKGLEISIFNEKFLENLKKMPYSNLAVQALKKLLEDEIKIRIRRNRIRFMSLKEMLEKLIEEYENRVISSKEIIKELIKLAREIKKESEAGRKMGLSEEELAFYDILSSGKRVIFDNEKIKEIVKKINKAIKRDITVDWNNHEIIKARLMANVKLILLQEGIRPPEVDYYTQNIFQQAVYLYA